jgi:Na+-driven multidrug efflux pump
MIKKGRRWTYVLMLAVAIVAVLVYPIALGILTDKPEFAESTSPFRWLMLGLVLAAGYIPFGQTLLMAGRPAWHTGLMIATVLANVIGNSILIPTIGIDGAAIATSIAMFASVFMLKALVRWKVGLQL